MRIKVAETEGQIVKGILNSFLPEITRDFNRAATTLKKTLPNLIRKIVMGSPEYYSLIAGQLRPELGIPDPEDKIAGLINSWSSNIDFKFKPPKIVGYKLVASVNASMFKADFSEVINTPNAKVYDTIRGYELPWLSWLVFYGNIPIITDYVVEYGASPRSRTGEAVMRNIGGSWSVPPSYSGTIANNWITRAIETNSTVIESLLNRVFR